MKVDIKESFISVFFFFNVFSVLCHVFAETVTDTFDGAAYCSCTETEFINDNFVEVSGHNLESSQT